MWPVLVMIKAVREPGWGEVGGVIGIYTESLPLIASRADRFSWIVLITGLHRGLNPARSRYASMDSQYICRRLLRSLESGLLRCSNFALLSRRRCSYG